MERDHWDTLFDELYLRTYARVDREVNAEQEALGAVALAGAEPGADVLDAPCGYGRHSTVLARAGYRVVGADRCPPSYSRKQGAAPGKATGRIGCRPITARTVPFEDASFDVALNLFPRPSATAARKETGARSASSGALCAPAAASSS